VVLKEEFDAALEALHQVRKSLREEIAEYPRPISGCDAQFNHLLALRVGIDSALVAMTAQVTIPTSRNP